MKHPTAKRIGALLLTLALVFSLPGLMGLAQGDAPQPTVFEGDIFITSGYGGGLSIDGFTREYIASLNDAQKADIAVSIPATYKGKPVTALGEKAFATFIPKYDYYDSTVNFTSLDLSGAQNLTAISNYAFYSSRGANGFTGVLRLPPNVQSIGSCAFQNCAGFSGDLTLPDSLTALSNSSFDGCSGLNGALRLSTNPSFTAIPQQAFNNCGFTGTLTLPANITSIGPKAFSNTRFSGALNLPDTIHAIKSAAFSDCTGFTGVPRLPSGLAVLESQTFQGCSGLSGALVLPDTLTSIGSQCFYGTALETVYLPDNPDTVLVNGGSAFNSCGKLTALVSPAALYENYKAKVTASTPKKLLAYPVTVTFEGTGAAIERLYNLPLNYVRNAQGVWSADSGYALPEVTSSTQPGFDHVWSFTDTGLPTQAGVSPASKVTGSVLHAVNIYSAPVITQGEPTLHKEYDGTQSLLSITATHPLADQLLIYYDWHKVNHYQGGRVQWSTSNTYAVQEIEDSAGGEDSWYQVTVYAYDRATQKQFFKSGEYYFDVEITHRTPTVNPSCETTVFIGDGLPDLSLSPGDSQGTIAWDPEQTPALGQAAYSWTFTPADPAHDLTVTGAVTLQFIDTQPISVTVQGNGAVTPAGAAVDAPIGQDMTFTFTPQAGHKVAGITVDGAAQPAASGYTFYNVRKPHALTVEFAPLAADDAEDMIASLPSIADAQTPQEAAQAADAILAAKEHYEAMPAGQDSISPAARTALHEALATLPQVQVSVHLDPAVQADRVSIANPSDLLSAMTQQEAQALRDGSIEKFELVLALGPAAPSAQEAQALIQALKDQQPGRQYGITLEKQITSGGVTQGQVLSALPAPIHLAFPIPEELKAPVPLHRSYCVLRAHTNADGAVQIDQLSDSTPLAPDVITIATDRFSTYMLAYQDAPERYAVTFETDGAGTVPAQTLAYGEKAALPAQPEKAGFRFIGWFAAGADSPWDFDTPITGPITLCARFIPIPAEATASPGAGSPQATGGTCGQTTPATGDSAPYLLFIALCLGSALILSIALGLRYRRGR
ncbi:leucine-rich repeat protein [Christensenellaceae bacterium NSJ-44]|uniref:Leucine-rich repeat protein n=1 Tax=Luoshenia tenuis TaxID=2763654 RepID=A0A926HN23_9FIRM|nr:leucine-rich repeat protein [Luoshenia tenuis]MBC8529205.1 leucine-rich repeat protein [Luoshenia tenuis]